MSDEDPELIIKWIDIVESKDHEDENPYSICDGQWGGMGGQTWYRGKDTGDVFEINGGIEEVQILRVWRNREKKWDKDIKATDWGQLRREVSIYNINCWRQKNREDHEKLKFTGQKWPSYFSKIVMPKIGNKDLSKLKEYDYDIRKVLLENEHSSSN